MTSEKQVQRILWGIRTPRTMRPHWALHELNLLYDLRAIQTRSADAQTAEFTALNSRQKFTESAAIVAYLSERYASADNDYCLPANQIARVARMVFFHHDGA